MDDADKAGETTDFLLQAQIAAERADLPAGTPGECDTYGNGTGITR